MTRYREGKQQQNWSCVRASCSFPDLSRTNGVTLEGDQKQGGKGGDKEKGGMGGDKEKGG